MHAIPQSLFAIFNTFFGSTGLKLQGECRTRMQLGMRGRRACKQKKKAGGPPFLSLQTEIYA